MILRPSLKIFSEAFEIFFDEIFDADQPHANAVFGKLEDAGLGAVENYVGVVTGGQGLLLNHCRGVDQAAKNRLLFDDARIVLDVRDARQAVHQLRNIGNAAGRFLSWPLRINSSTKVTVSIACCFSPSWIMRSKMWRFCGKKILGPQRFNGGVERVIIEQDGAEDTPLGFEIMRQRAFECGVRGHDSLYLRLCRDPAQELNSICFFSAFRTEGWNIFPEREAFCGSSSRASIV